MIENIVKIYEKIKPITVEVLEGIKNDIKPGVSVKTIVEKWENYIREKGFLPGFPINVSINEVAAHMTPGINYDYTIPDNGLVKVDLGVQHLGYTTDVAFTITLGDGDNELVKIAEDALEQAKKVAGPGVTVQEISNTIAEVLEANNVNPIRELGGHLIQEFVLHGPIFIPNHKIEKPVYEFKPGDVFALEIFATRGCGRIEERSQGNIFSINVENLIFLRAGKDVVNQLYNKYKTLPFANRWEKQLFTYRKVTIRQLIRKRIIHEYKPLVEKTNKPVAQAECTVIVTENDIITIP